jgi:hypothetical protein
VVGHPSIASAQLMVWPGTTSYFHCTEDLFVFTVGVHTQEVDLQLDKGGGTAAQEADRTPPLIRGHGRSITTLTL